MYCLTCSYDLRGTATQGVCPECGRSFDPADASTYAIRSSRVGGPLGNAAKRAPHVLLVLFLVVGYLVLPLPFLMVGLAIAAAATLFVVRGHVRWMWFRWRADRDSS